ncbi:MAG: hypothetical protein J6V73_08600 [Spirochaetaceae bacterium]|nr:hypothetical protein [Spirochaetaceae bacterium]
MTDEKTKHWADEEEVIKTNLPLKFTLNLFKVFPSSIVRLCAYPVSFFYLLFSRRARTEALLYQNHLRTCFGSDIPKKISPFHQILSFAFCVLEKFEGWLGKVELNSVEFQNDDIEALISQLEMHKGAVIICSHLGNSELLRSLSSYNRTRVSWKVPVISVMEIKSTVQFNSTLREINPDAGFNVIDPSEIGPDTIIRLAEFAEKGGLVVIAGDRTSARNRTKNIKKNFLGEEACFPYGTFLIPFLLKIPVYYMFGMRKKDVVRNPKYQVFVEKSLVALDVPRSKRDSAIEGLCEEFVSKLEKYCKLYPYQWYNFYNFWLKMEDDK